MGRLKDPGSPGSARGLCLYWGQGVSPHPPWTPAKCLLCLWSPIVGPNHGLLTVLRSQACSLSSPQRCSLRQWVEWGEGSAWRPPNEVVILAVLGAMKQGPLLGWVALSAWQAHPSWVGVIVWGAGRARPAVCLLDSARTSAPF
jgi:hypothetical protein